MQLDGAAYPWIADWYDFHWSLIGNLGIDLLVIPLAPIFGLELAVKLIVIAIPVLIVTGFLWIAREVHGRIPATALFALPIAYCYPVQFGFVNFALAMGLALNLFALWLRLGRLGRTGFRAGLFVPLSCLLWLCHTFGWGVLGVLAFSAEMIRQHDRMPGRGVQHWIMAWIRAGIGCVPLALPLALMVFWRSGDHVTGVTGDWFNWRTKFGWLAMVLRDRWLAFDFASAMILYLILVRGLRDRTIEYSRNLALSAIFLFAVFFLLPARGVRLRLCRYAARAVRAGHRGRGAAAQARGVDPRREDARAVRPRLLPGAAGRHDGQLCALFAQLRSDARRARSPAAGCAAGVVRRAAVP